MLSAAYSGPKIRLVHSNHLPKLLGFIIFFTIGLIGLLLSYSPVFAANYYVSNNGFDGNVKVRDTTFADIYFPYGIAVVDNKPWITDPTNSRIIVFNSNGTPVYTTLYPITGNGLNSPRSLTTVLNGSTTYVWVVNSAANTISIFNTTGSAYGSPLSGNGLNAPYGIANVTQGENHYIWVSNSADNTISVFNVDGTALNGGTSYSGNGLNTPRSILQVGSQVWIVNTGNDTVSRFNTDGSSAGAVLSGNNLYDPVGIAMIESQVWVGNYSEKISLFNTDGSVGGTTITGNGLSNITDISSVPTAAGTFVWVLNGGNATISFFDADGTSAARNCTELDPCATLNYTGSKASAGDTIYFAAGTYYGVHSVGKNGVAGNPITIRPSGSVTFDACPSPASISCQRATHFSTGTYNIVDGFTFRGMLGRGDWVPGADLTTGYFISLGNSSILRNSIIEHYEGSGSGCVTGCTFTNNVYTDIGTTSHYHPIYSTGDANTVSNNTFNSTAGFGIHLYGAGINNFTVINNKITLAENGGIHIQNTNGTATTGIVSGNFIYNNGWGMTAPSATTVTNNIVANNTYNPSIGIFNTDTTLDKYVRTIKVNTFAGAVVGSQVWTTNFFDNSISRYNTDGTSADVDITGNGLNSPRGIALVGSQVWVANRGNNSILRFNQDGTLAAAAITGNGLSAPVGLGIVGTKVWVADSGSCATLSVFNFDGTSSGTYNMGDCYVPTGVAAVGSEVWAISDSPKIARYTTGGVFLGLIEHASFNKPFGIAVIGSEVWVANANGHSITRLDTSGTVLGTFATNQAVGVAPVGSKAWILKGGSGSSNFAQGGAMRQSNNLSGSFIYNNVFYRNGYREVESLPNNTVIKNNLFIGYDTNTTGDLALKFTGTGSVADNNVYYNLTITNNGITGGTNSLTSNPTLYNAAGISYASSNFYLLPGSPAIDAGADVGVTTDYDGNSRPLGTTYDVGAFEYKPLTVTVEQASGQLDPTNASSVNFTVVFSESVSNFVSGDVTLAGMAGATTATVTGSGTTYNIAVTGMTVDGTIIASIAGNVATGPSYNINLGSTSTDNTITYDNTFPSGGSLTYSSQSTTSKTVSITVDDGTDSLAGINTATRTLQRKSASFVNGTCGSFGSFEAITPSGTYPNFTDTTLASGNCYQYRYIVSDNAANQTIYTSESIFKVSVPMASQSGDLEETLILSSYPTEPITIEDNGYDVKVEILDKNDKLPEGENPISTIVILAALGFGALFLVLVFKRKKRHSDID